MLDTVRLSLLEQQLKKKNSPLVQQGWVAGIEVDQLCFFRPKGIGLLGFIAQVDEDYLLTDDVMDTVCHYLIEGHEVMVEVPMECMIDMKALFQYAASSKFHIAFLPPANAGDPAYWASYELRLCEAVKLFFSYRNFSTYLHPITGFIHYLMCEAIGYQPDSISEDQYINERFVEPFPKDRMDSLKNVLRDQLMEIFGSEDELKQLLHGMAYGMTKRMESLAREGELLRGNENTSFFSECFVNGLLLREPRFKAKKYSRYAERLLQKPTGNKGRSRTVRAQCKPLQRKIRPVYRGTRLLKGVRLLKGKLESK